jgi:adenylate cyclase
MTGAAQGNEGRDKTRELQARNAVVLCADVAGYGEMTAEDEAAARAVLEACRAELLDPTLMRFGGRIFKLIGDATLAEFPAAADALRCAAEIQKTTRGRAYAASGKRLALRIGINADDAIVDGEDLHGDAVNGAARLMTLAPAGGLCVSAPIVAQARDAMPLDLVDRGEHPMPFGNKSLHVFDVVL